MSRPPYYGSIRKHPEFKALQQLDNTMWNAVRDMRKTDRSMKKSMSDNLLKYKMNKCIAYAQRITNVMQRLSELA